MSFHRLASVSSFGSRSARFRAPLTEAELAELPKPPADVDPLTLPTLQQAALIFMHESQVKRAVYARLLEDAQDRPYVQDYFALVELKLATKRPQDKWHCLTPRGSVKAAALEQALCKRFGIHLFAVSYQNCRTTRAKCPCGWSTSVRYDPNATGRLHAAFARHVDSEAIAREEFRESIEAEACA